MNDSPMNGGGRGMEPMQHNNGNSMGGMQMHHQFNDNGYSMQGMNGFYHQQQMQDQTPVIIIYNLDPERFNCDRLFNLMCLFGNIGKKQSFPLLLMGYRKVGRSQ